MSKNTSSVLGGGSSASPRRGSFGGGGQTCQLGTALAVRPELQPGLETQPLEDRSRDPGYARHRGLGKVTKGGDAGGLQPANVYARDPCDAAQMVGLLETLLRRLGPASPASIEPGMGGAVGRPRRLELEERLLDLPVVGEEVQGLEGQLVLVAEHEHQLRRAHALDRLEQVGVGAELHQEVGPG